MQQVDRFYLGPDWRQVILDKVAEVLAKADLVSSIDIRVQASLDEAPMISYSVDELLLPRKEEK